MLRRGDTDTPGSGERAARVNRDHRFSTRERDGLISPRAKHMGGHIVVHIEEEMAVRPQDVKSPKEHWTLIDVLIETADWSLALGEWDGDRRLAVRWNGDDERPKGNPVSHGMPTWFVLPDEFIDLLLESSLISSEKSRLARVCLGTGAPHMDLETLISQITEDNRHPEASTGPAVGREFR